MKVEALCEQGPRAKHDSGARPARSIRLVVIHSAETTNARGVAAFFAGSAQASTQLAADQTRCVRMLPDLVIPWGAPGVNQVGLHIEICGYAKWTRAQWLQRKTMLQRAAFKVGRWCWQYDIPVELVDADRLKLGRKTGLWPRGITSHANASKAFPDIGSGHTDPGRWFPWSYFLELVDAARERHAGEWL